MPSKKLTAQKRDELKKMKQKQQQKQKKSSGFSSFIVLLIIIVVVIAAAFFVLSNMGSNENNKNTNGKIKLFAYRDFAVVSINSYRNRIEVLNNDILPNNNVYISNITTPSHGTAEIMDGETVNYIPEANYSGHDDFLYTISDGENESTNASFIYVADKNPFALFHTSMGDFVIELFEDKVPITVRNFIDLAKQGYYNGVIFHRVISNFMIQAGDPTGTGSDGHAANYHEGYGEPDNPDSWVIPDEFNENLSNEAGTISMANSGPNTGGSQFFINVANNYYLDYNKYLDPTTGQIVDLEIPYPQDTSKHAVFGRVMLGIDTVFGIAEVKTDSNDKPLTDVVINSIEIANDL